MKILLVVLTVLVSLSDARRPGEPEVDPTASVARPPRPYGLDPTSPFGFRLLPQASLRSPNAADEPVNPHLARASLGRIRCREGEVLPGIARPSRDVKLALPIEGVVRRIHVREGGLVTEGQVLVELDTRVAGAAVTAARVATERKSGLASAEHDIVLAATYLARLEKSGARGATTDAAIDEARTRHKKAEAILLAEQEKQEQAQLNLRIEEARLGQHYLGAPFSGRVVAIAADVGATVGSTDFIVRLVTLDVLEVELHLPARLYGTVSVGQSVKLAGGPPVDGPLEGKIITIDPLIDATTETFRCVLTVPNPEDRMPAGFTVTLHED